MGLIFIYSFRNISRETERSKYSFENIYLSRIILLFSFSLLEKIKKVYKVFIF